jgi:branched-chain amino acid transport system permease protein
MRDSIWSPIRRLDTNSKAIIVIGIVAVFVPQFVSGSSLDVATRIVLFAGLSSAWNVMAGYAGLFSFGHAAFFGLGAYSTAYLLAVRGISPAIGLVVGAAAGALFGLLLGYLTFRYKLRGAYFVLTTFAFAEMLYLIAMKFGPINGAVGLRVPIRREESWWWMQFAPNSPNYYYLMLIYLLVALAAINMLTRSRTGQYIVAVRDDEDAASALGINPLRSRLTAVAWSGALTAAGGTFYFQYLFFIEPPLAFGPDISVQILLPGVVGGMGTFWGPLVGSGLLVMLGEFTSTFVRRPPDFLSFLQGRSGLDLALYGAMLIGIIMFLPRGVYGSIEHRWQVRKERKLHRRVEDPAAISPSAGSTEVGR